MESISIGDIVFLVCGSPKMAVLALVDDGSSARCAWFDKKNFLHESVFPVIALRIIREEYEEYEEYEEND